LKFCETIIIIPTLVYGSRTYDKGRKIVGKIQAPEIVSRCVPIIKKKELISCLLVTEEWNRAEVEIIYSSEDTKQKQLTWTQTQPSTCCNFQTLWMTLLLARQNNNLRKFHLRK